MASYETPSFLKNRSVSELYARIREILPKDIDISAGGHGWNMTRPVALIGAEICEFVLPEVIKLILPGSSYGEFLDGHARRDGLTRRSAVAASGEITITGEANSFIPAGSLFSVPAVNDQPSIDYATTADITISSDGAATADVVCTQTGIVGNTGENTIILVSSKLTGVTSVTNAKEITGGTEEESDESLIARINEYDKTQGFSFVGNEADYKRWAEDVDGVGTATVISAEDDSGTVTIILTDDNGAPANETLRENVYNKIMSPNDREQRLAPIGAILVVVAPQTNGIGIKAVIELEAGATIEDVKEKFAAVLSLYLAEALDDEEVKYSQVWAKLASVSGVADFKNLQIGLKTDAGITYGTSNIPISDMQLPTVDEADLLLTTGTV